MQLLMRYLKVFLVMLIVLVAGYIFYEFYPYIFAKTIEGKILKVERVQINVALMQNTNAQNQAVNPELFSFAVAIQTADGAVHTASAEDRQWAAVSEGLCVKAKFFPYPPWQLDKAGTFYGARLLDSHVCN